MPTLRIDGLTADGEPLVLTDADLAAAPVAQIVPDVGRLVPGRRGTAVRFDWIIDRADPPQDARWVTIESADGAFVTSLPIEELDVAVVAFADGERPFDESDGGPFRLYVPGYRDACANVKHLARISFADVPYQATRAPEADPV